jgi:hypothetical protein
MSLYFSGEGALHVTQHEFSSDTAKLATVCTGRRVVTVNKDELVLNMRTPLYHGEICFHRVAHQNELTRLRTWFRGAWLNQHLLAFVQGWLHGFSSNPKPLEPTKTPKQKHSEG